MRYVLDSSAIFTCKGFDSRSELNTTPNVLKEIKAGGRVRKHLEFLLAAGLKVREPNNLYVNRVQEVAGVTGDIGKLSDTDISIIALALETGAVIISDDYAIQNVARVMRIEYLGLGQDVIKKVLHWEYKCTGCGRKLPDKKMECPVCGHNARAVVKKRNR